MVEWKIFLYMDIKICQQLINNPYQQSLVPPCTEMDTTLQSHSFSGRRNMPLGQQSGSVTEEEAADPHAVNRLESHVFIQRDAKVRGGGHDWYVWQAGRCAEVPVLEPRTRVSRRWSRD